MIQHPTALHIHFVGVQDVHPLEGLALAVRAALAARGAELPEVSVAQVAALERGATGKAPLIMALRPPAGTHS